jgi:proline iminopeptidase
MALSSRQAAPIVVLHGGPSVPSDYLFPLVEHIPYRSIVFYDQIGCGRSDEPQDVNAYSIDQAVDDLESLLKKLGVQRRGFHLYGQSFGGILAFEYIKRVAERNNDSEDNGCLSVVLSSVPTSVHQVEAQADMLVNGLAEKHANCTDFAELFRTTYQCRTPETSKALEDAYAHAGTVWRGTSAIEDYVAKPPSQKASRMPSALVTRGEYDFVTETCVEEWRKSLFNHQFVRQVVFEGCAHHGLLEQGQTYGQVLERFFAQYD